MEKFILIIDDDSDDVQFLMEALHQTNQAYDCVAVSNGEEALRFLNDTNEKPDFIFLDLNMPRINGKECLIKIKSNDQFIDIPVVIYSTTSQKREMDELYRLGASYFLTKPHSFHVLLNSLEGILSGRASKIKH
jgi:CheY-like chemotaxis protein